MKLSQVAAQLYTVRDHLRTPAEITAALKRIRKIGYGAVELAGLEPAIAAEELARMLDGEGLVCCATHEPSQVIFASPERLAERLRRLGGCRYAVCPSPGSGVDLGDAAQVRELARRLDRAGAVLREAGGVLAYHNHAFEWVRPAESEKLAMEMIFDGSAPENLKAELDTYWVQYGGGDPVDWCCRLDGRLRLMHLKDYAFTTEDRPVMAEIGRGTLNFREIIRAAEASGCEWFIVEQDVCPGDPFESLERSWEFIIRNLVE